MPSHVARCRAHNGVPPFLHRVQEGLFPPQRDYVTIRLSTARLAALRCLRLAIPLLDPMIRPRQLGTGVGQPGSHRRFDDGNDRVSQVPEHPSCPFALILAPGWTENARPLQRLRHGPRLCQQRRLPQTKISGLDHTALGVTVYASQ